MNILYSPKEKDEIGNIIASVFLLRRDSKRPNTYKTMWGNKTPIGIFETFLRIVKEIEAGTIRSILLNK